MTTRKKIPEWLATTLSFILLGLLFIAYFVFYKPAPLAAPAQPAVSANVPAVSAPSFVHPLAIGNAKLMVAYALTPAAQEQGLSDTPTLASNNGMLFIFTTDSVIPFWMKDMNYSLDIIWIGADKTVKDITPNLAPSTYPNAFSPKVPIRYALEVPAGFAAANNITVGSQVSF